METPYFIPQSEIIENSVQDLEFHVKESIIPRMAKRRKREHLLTGFEIHEKLFRLPATGKPGETFELEEQIRIPNDGVDGEIASEFADMVYYTWMENCSTEDKRTLDFWLEWVSVPEKAVLEFCIIKYETRLVYGDEKNYKEIELKNLTNFIEITYPELKNIWTNPETQLPIES